MARAALLGLVLAVLGCGAPNLLGRPVHVTSGTYHTVSGELPFALAVPPAPSDRRAVAVYLEGDGSVCQGYSECRWRRFVERRAGHFALAWPAGTGNLACGEPAWRQSDFSHRLQELGAFLPTLRERFPGARVVLIGSSAGATLAALYAASRPGEIAAIVNLGGGLLPLSAVLPAIQHERTRQGQQRADEEAQNLRELERTFAKVRAAPNSSELLWGRSLRFWNQMFFNPVAEVWPRLGIPVLVVHGRRDLDSVPFSSVQALGTLIGVTYLFLDDHGHDLLDEIVWRQVDDWLRDQVSASAYSD